MSGNNENFWDSLRGEIKGIGTDTRASDMRRFKAYMINRVFAMEQGTKIRETLLKTQEQKLEALQQENALLREFAKEAISLRKAFLVLDEMLKERGIYKEKPIILDQVYFAKKQTCDSPKWKQVQELLKNEVESSDSME